MILNIRESLNRLDLQTDNKYDLRNTYDCSKISDDKKKELAEALNKNASAKTISRILDENSSIKVFPRDSEEYEKLDRVATFLTAMSPNKYYYYVGKTYFDYGQDWKWTTILAQKNDNGSYGDSYQALNPREQEEIILANSDEELEEIARNILRDAHVDKGFSESLTETINAKDSMVAQEFNYTMQYGDQASDVNAAVIIIPGGLMINGEPADLTVYAEDENGEVINFKSVKEANDWINKYKDDVEFHIEQGNELHATPSAYYNSFDESLNDEVLYENDKFKIIYDGKFYNLIGKEDNEIYASYYNLDDAKDDAIKDPFYESLTEAIKDVNSLHSKIWNMDNNEKICFPNGYCVKCEFYDREGKAKRYIVTNKKDNVIIKGKFGFAWQPQIKKFEEDFFNLLNGRSVDESLNEADYGGAYDIENDMFFTREEINELAENVCDELQSRFGYDYETVEVGMNSTTELYLCVQDIHGIEEESTFKIDMRKIRKPSDLFKYAKPIAGRLAEKFEEEYQYYDFDESLTEAKKVGSNKISQGMNLPGKNFEFVKVIDGIVSSKDRYECRIYSRELDSNYKTYGFYQGEVIFSEDYDPQLIDSVFPDEGTKVKLAIYRVPEDDPDHDWTGDYFVDYIDETNESLSEDYEDDVDNWQYLDTDQDYKKKKDYFGDIETVDEQLYKIVCKSGASEWPFESALSYEDAQEIVEYYGGRWIDERGFEWSMEIEEDDESTERVYPFDESLNEDASKPDFVVGFYAGQVDDETLELINPEKLVEVNVNADELKERYGKEAEKLLNDYTVQTADRLKNSSGMLQQMILQTAEQKAIYAHRLFSKFDEVKDRLGSNTYMDRKIEEINYPFRDGIRDLSKKLGKILLPKRENLTENVYDEESDFDDGEVEEGDTFIEDGRTWSWIERIAGPIHLDFDNWAVWSARDWDYIEEKVKPLLINKEEFNVEVLTKIYDEAEVAYFVVDEDTGFIDWGPVETSTEAQDFLNGKVEDYENDEEYEEIEIEEESLTESINQNDVFKFLDEIKDTVSSFKNRVQEVSEYFDISEDEAEDFVYDWEQENSLTESRAIRNDGDYEVTLHYDDIGDGKEYDYKLGYDEVVDYLREIAWSNGDGPEDANEDEYLEWVMDNFDELSDRYESNVLNYFESEASQYEYDHRNDEP